MRSNNHLRVLFHQLLLRLSPPLILVVLFVRRPLFSVLRLFSILPLFPYTLQNNHDFLPTPPNTPNPVLPNTRPTPLRPLHLIDLLRFPHPFIYVSIRLQSLKKLSAIPGREVGSFALIAHFCCQDRLLSCRRGGAHVWGLRGEDTCTWRNVCGSRASDTWLLCGRVHCCGESDGGCIVFVMIRLGG